LFGIQLYILIFAVKGQGQKLRAELQEVGADLAAGEGERIKGVEVDVGGY
jgi:hypothetical protein